MRLALGIIECLGLSTAIEALDAAAKSADVKLVGYDKVIGVEGAVGVSIQIGGEVAAVKAAVEAGLNAGNRVGRVISAHVIPRPHEELDPLLKTFEKNIENRSKKDKKNKSSASKSSTKPTKKDENINNKDQK